MSSPPPSAKDLAAVHALWDKLAVFPLTQIDGACRFLMTTVGEWLDAYNAAWIGTVRLLRGRPAEQDALSGWRTATLVFLHAPDPQEQILAKQVFAHHRPEPGMTGMAVAKQAGKFRVHRLHDGFVDWKVFQKTLHYEAFYRQLDVRDRLWVVTPMGTDAESIFVFDKRGPGPSGSAGGHSRTRFGTAQVRLAAYAIRGLVWFQRDLMYSYGLPLVDSPLTSMERRVVQLLLSEKSEKQIAAALRQSTHTTHGHIKEIYRKYGVQGRAALMAIWLSKS